MVNVQDTSDSRKLLCSLLALADSDVPQRHILPVQASERLALLMTM